MILPTTGFTLTGFADKVATGLDLQLVDVTNVSAFLTFCYSMCNLLLVISAIRIAKDEIKQGKVVDLDLVELAALFHDIGDAKFHKEGQPTGREIVMAFLSKHQYQKADDVAKIVENVSFRKELAGVRNEWAESCIELHM